MTLYEFLQWQQRGGPDRLWLKQPGFEVYVRFGPRVIRQRDVVEHLYQKVLDIANVNAVKRGRGTFKRFYSDAEAMVPTFKLDAIYVELVQDVRFANFFIRNGFLLCDSRDQALSLAKVWHHHPGGTR